MRHGFAGCYQAVMVALILFVGLAAAAAAVDVFFVAPEDPDDDETRAGRRFIPINVGWVLIAGDSDGVDPESWAWDPDDKVTKVPEEPETATCTSAEPDEALWVRVSASGGERPGYARDHEGRDLRRRPGRRGRDGPRPRPVR